ncbi:hypothetical protein BGZ75_010409 [Mortierella antarctica]|nr:hypothetical protein BGZ75_010409 [Mortierella antarctica]
MTRRSSQLITLFCIINGQPSSSAFCIKISNGFTVDDLKTSIKTKQSQLAFFKNIEAINLRLWKVLIDEASHCDKVVLLSDVSGMEKKLLMSTDRLSAIFSKPPRDGYIHIVIENTGTAPECQQYQDLAPDEATTPNSPALCTAKDINTRQRDLVSPVQSSVSDQVKQEFSREISTVLNPGTALPEDKPPQYVNFNAQDPAPCAAAIISNETRNHDLSLNSIATGEASHHNGQDTPVPSHAVVARTLKLKRTFSFMEETPGDTPEQDIKRVCFLPQKDSHVHSVDSTAADKASDHSEQGTPESSNPAAARKLRRIISFMDGDSGSPPEQDSPSFSTNTCFVDQNRHESSERIHLIHQAQDAIRNLDQKRRRAILDLLQNSLERNGPAREQASSNTLENLENTANTLRRHLRDIIDRIENINKWLQRAEDLDT